MKDKDGYTLLHFILVTRDQSLFTVYGSQLVKWGASLTALHSIYLKEAHR